MINIKLSDGTIFISENPIISLEILKKISSQNIEKVFAVKIDGEIRELTHLFEHDCEIEFLTWDAFEARAVFWHSSAHLMAAAIEQLYPNAKFGIGPDIDIGFYYDIDFGDINISEEDLPRIEQKMYEIVNNNPPIIREEISKSEALEYFRKKGDEYKIELIEELEDGNISLYHLGNFTDLCRGPHLPNVRPIKAIKLLSIAGAYWRGDITRKQLTRIYGVTFPEASMLEQYLQMIEEAKKRDHRKLGKELELFAFSHNVGSGLPLWLPRGVIIREQLEQFLKKIQRVYGYHQVITPHIANKYLYVVSGHYEKYGSSSFRPIASPIEGEEFFLKPMNCPHHCEIYASKPRSYRELPLRLAEFGTVYRYEQSGELHGLTRVRGFTQDDAHIFCTPDQIEEEFIRVIQIVQIIFDVLNFRDYTAQISLRDPNDRQKYIGSDENWEKSEKAIINACRKMGLQAIEVKGEAAFYGPKLDFLVKDAIGRQWQLGTIQVDYNLPERFNLEYVSDDNERHRPVIIHRAPFGSMERFVAVLLEHTAGKLPFWLAPEQVAILPISEKVINFAKHNYNLLEKENFRVILDGRNEKIGKKIREAELKKIPFMVVIGEKEAYGNTISVREHAHGDMGSMNIEQFILFLHEKINTERDQKVEYHLKKYLMV